MESETKIIIKKKEGETYKTPIYIRKSVKAYEQRMKKDSPDKYQKLLDRKKENYLKRKARLALQHAINSQEIVVI